MASSFNPNQSRSKPLPSRRSVSSASGSLHHDNGRVRVSVRVRPKDAADLSSDADFADCVELQPELRRLNLRKNNWTSETYRFDKVFTETASQKRVYESAAKPVVESVLCGYNGTIMAYGQTGTGKTYTVGRLGKSDASERGIMVRAVEDIIANAGLETDVVEVSYLQLYLESIQDLLAPEKVNISLNEDPGTGEVSLPSATKVQVRDLDCFSELLQRGEANRHTANTNQNTESSRSHAILMVSVRRSIQQNVEDAMPNQDRKTDALNSNGIPRVRKSKLLIIDLAGSDRLDKSGSEGQQLEEAKFINLSLTSLGKCINALAENSSHIPTRDSKLTRLLRDSFGGSARTSLIITIASSFRHLAETTSTIMFGQRAMKIVNMVKLKEEFDYESLCRKLETQVDHLTEKIERESTLGQKEKFDLEEQLKECRLCIAEMEKKLVARTEQHKVDSIYQSALAETTRLYEKKIAEPHKNKRARFEGVQEQLDQAKKHHIIDDLAPEVEPCFVVDKLKKEVESLKLEIAALQSVNRKLSDHLSCLIQASVQKSPLEILNDDKLCEIAGDGRGEVHEDESPTTVIEVQGGDTSERTSLPKSISVRSNSNLKSSPSKTRGVTGPEPAPLKSAQKVNLPSGETEEEKLEPQLQVNNKRMFKTELCNKWQESGACSYGTICRFAHGIAELRPVIRHPRYQTEVCRVVLAGNNCPYGHRCQFRHVLTEKENFPTGHHR